MVDVTHSSLTDAADLHEPKGALLASDKQVYVADGAGSGTFQTIRHNGWWDYNDLATASTPIALTLAATDYELTNDGAGAFTELSYAVPGSSNIWDVVTDRFDWTNLAIGDQVDIRFDVEFTTTSVNSTINLGVEMAVGGTPYTIPVISGLDIKSTGAYQQVITQSFYIGAADTLNNPARVLASADKTGVTVKVNGWYVRVTKYAP